MASERLREIERLFHEARERPAAERDAWLAHACAHDPTLRREVDSLLAQPLAGMIDRPVGAVVAGLVEAPQPRLAPGSSLGAYRIERLLDVGGMGEVYRAHDTTLSRDVAIKILPRHLTSDAERLARFEREARLLAALNHPHIAAIYGVVDADGIRGLVLEFVPGPTLADRLTSGPMAVGEALRVAHQIAEGLEAAHERGVVHRDLKPANIKITPEGVVKVLDFGLAKAVGADTAGPPLHESPTITSGGTTPGVILGTAAYMSPEQARGRPVDKRADIWAFGCVLYEMLTGRNSFDAGTASEAIAKILEREPDWDALPAGVPDAIRRLLKRCLRKDPSERTHDIADVRIEIADVMSAPGTSARTDRAESGTKRWRWIALASAVGAIGAIVLLAAVWRTRPTPITGLLEFRIDLADNAAFGIAMSPDGRRMAMGVCCSEGPRIWLHSFDSGETRPVPGTELGGAPFWSADGSAIGFFTASSIGRLKRVDLAGGPPLTICETKGSFPVGSWNANGDILFSAGSRILRVAASGGVPSRVDPIDGEGANAMRAAPAFLPDGRHFIYHVAGSRGGTIRLASLDSPETRHLVDSDYPATFASPSHLVFLRGAALMAQTLDPRTFEVEGPASLVADEVAPGYLGALVKYWLPSASTTGVLAFVTTRGGSAGQLTWFDRAGRISGSIEPPQGGEYLNPAISPNGEQVAVNRHDPQTGNWDIWILDVARHVWSRLTFDPAQDTDPVWSPDGTQIAFASNRGGRFGLYRKNVDGSGAEEPLATFEEPVIDLFPSDWSPDGRFMLYSISTSSQPAWAVWKVGVGDEAKSVPILRRDFNSFDGRLSPDGQWIAYTAFETGAQEVYVQRFGGGDKRQISRGGGAHPRWTENGRELVYWAVPGGVANVDLETSGSQLRIGTTRTLIATRILALFDSRSQYDVTRDGQHFLLRQPLGGKPPAVTVMVNWTEKLRK